METSSSMQFTLNPKAQEISRKQLLEWEKDLIGVYISHHPLAYLSELLKERTTHTTAEITEELEHKKIKVKLGGTIKEARRLTTKKGDTMCVVQLEDMYGTIGVTVFPKVYEQTADKWVEGTVVVVRGDVQVRRDEPGILCDDVSLLEAIEEEMNRKRYQIWLRVQISGNDDISVSNDIMKIQNIKRFISERPGRDHYEIVVANREWEVRLAPQDDTIHYTEELRAKLEGELGPGMVQVQEMDFLPA
jgi:DNA polymerase-3 subunit alpha